MLVTLQRDGDRSLAFDGELIGQGSSARADSVRWFEAAIYRISASGRYVVSGIGRSTVTGETDRCWAVDVDTAEEVVAHLTRVDEDGVSYLTRTARDALAQAAAKDPAISGAFMERVL